MSEGVGKNLSWSVKVHERDGGSTQDSAKLQAGSSYGLPVLYSVQTELDRPVNFARTDGKQEVRLRGENFGKLADYNDPIVYYGLDVKGEGSDYSPEVEVVRRSGDDKFWIF